MLNEKAEESVLGYKPMSTHVMLATFEGTSHNLSIIQVDALTADSTEEEPISLYKDLDEYIQDIPRKDILMLIGDWNAKVESINDGWEAIMGKYGYGKRNDRGEVLWLCWQAGWPAAVQPTLNGVTAG